MEIFSKKKFITPYLVETLIKDNERLFTTKEVLVLDLNMISYLEASGDIEMLKSKIKEFNSNYKLDDKDWLINV